MEFDWEELMVSFFMSLFYWVGYSNGEGRATMSLRIVGPTT